MEEKKNKGIKEEVKRVFEVDSVLCGLITQAFPRTSLSMRMEGCSTKISFFLQ